jgi:hypothetical protein
MINGQQQSSFLKRHFSLALSLSMIFVCLRFHVYLQKYQKRNVYLFNYLC